MAVQKEKIIQLLTVLIKDAENRLEATIKKGSPAWDNFEIWRTSSLDAIQIIYNSTESFHYRNFSSLRFSENQPPGTPYDQQRSTITFTVGLQIAKEMLQGMLISASLWIPDNSQPQNFPIIFISHSEKAKLYLDRITNFLSVISVTPIILEKLPDYNLSPDQKINYYMNLCNVGMAIITPDDELVSGEKHPRQNVSYEIGLMQNSTNINGRILYLKEEKTKVPSGYDDKIWIPFSLKNCEETYIRILRELKGWNFPL